MREREGEREEDWWIFEGAHGGRENIGECLREEHNIL